MALQRKAIRTKYIIAVSHRAAVIQKLTERFFAHRARYLIALVNNGCENPKHVAHSNKQWAWQGINKKTVKALHWGAKIALR